MAWDQVFSGLWLFGDNPAIAEPVPQNWRWNDPEFTHLAFNETDYNMVDRSTDLAALEVADRIFLRSIATNGNWAMFDVVTVTDNATWFDLEVVVYGTGPVPGFPINRQRCLFDFLRPLSTGELDLADVAARVATKLHVSDAAEVGDAVDAAVVYVRTYTGMDEAGLELPGDALTFQGLVLLAERIYLDPSAPNGVLGGFGDSSFVPSMTPEELAKHNRDYWDRLAVSWGIA